MKRFFLVVVLVGVGFTIGRLTWQTPDEQMAASPEASFGIEGEDKAVGQTNPHLGDSLEIEATDDKQTVATGYDFRLDETVESVSSPETAKTESARSLLSKLYVYGTGTIE